MTGGLKEEMLSININGKALQVAAGTTILQAAEDAGIYIPALCGHPGLDNLGCRLCAVYVEGRSELPLACQTSVEEGMLIYTETPRVWSWRRRKLRTVSDAYQSPCLECQRVEACDSSVCGRKNIPVGRRCSTCDEMETCSLRRAARHIREEHVIFHRLGG